MEAAGGSGCEGVDGASASLGAVVTRVDLKAEREDRVLAVKSAHIEPGAEEGEIVGPLAGELTRMARWLGLERVSVARKGMLAATLKAGSRRRTVSRTCHHDVVEDQRSKHDDDEVVRAITSELNRFDTGEVATERRPRRADLRFTA